MRKFLIELILISVAFTVLWLFAGQQISGWVDRYTTAKIESSQVKVIGYHGSGDGGELTVGDHQFSLAPLNPHVGSTKDNELALAHAGKVFAFGPLLSRSSEVLITKIPNPESNFLMTRRSYVPWLTFDSSAKPHLHRQNYYEFTSKNSNGAKLDMIWSININAAEDETTSLIRIQITNAGK
jgi:hypothetical protein